MAIIAPFSNLTIITTNSIPKEREKERCADCVADNLTRAGSRTTHSLSAISSTVSRFVRTVSLHRGRPERREGGPIQGSAKE